MFLGWPGWVFLDSLLYQFSCSTTCGQPVRSSDHSQQIWLQQTRSVWISGSMVLTLIWLNVLSHLLVLPSDELSYPYEMNWEATMCGFSEHIIAFAINVDYTDLLCMYIDIFYPVFLFWNELVSKCSNKRLTMRLIFYTHSGELNIVFCYCQIQ